MGPVTLVNLAYLNLSGEEKEAQLTVSILYSGYLYDLVYMQTIEGFYKAYREAKVSD